jgi:hypothetical protein
MIDDAEIRGVLLTHFHKLRDDNGGWCPTSEIILSPHPVSRAAIANACQDLAEAGYIRWEAFNPPIAQHAIGKARITGTGKDVVTGARVPTIHIRFPSDVAAPTYLASASPETPLATARPISAFLAASESLSSSAPFSQTSVPVSSTPEVRKSELLTLKPMFMGIGIDLKELWWRFSAWRKNSK